VNPHISNPTVHFELLILIFEVAETHCTEFLVCVVRLVLRADSSCETDLPLHLFILGPLPANTCLTTSARSHYLPLYLYPLPVHTSPCLGVDFGTGSNALREICFYYPKVLHSSVQYSRHLATSPCTCHAPCLHTASVLYCCLACHRRCSRHVISIHQHY